MWTQRLANKTYMNLMLDSVHPFILTVFLTAGDIIQHNNVGVSSHENMMKSSR